MQPILLLLLATATFALANADNGLVFSSKFKRDTAAQAGPVNPIAQTAMNKHKLNEELEKNVEGMRQGCFPRPRGVGCRCTEKDAQGHDLEKVFDTDAECKLGHQNSSDPIVQTAMNKHLLNEEFKQRVEGLREGCFPRPQGVGCRCTEKDAEGQDRERIFETDAECKKFPGQQREKREARVQQNVQQQQDVVPRTQQQQHKNVPVAGGGVDPVAERARQNYAAVLDELKNKFAGLREGCYPRPKGCLCVVGKDATGREVTERRMKDSDCKCAQGERSRDCPAASRGA